MIGGVAGITSDANSLVNYARSVAQKHLLQYNQDIPVEQLAQRLCDMKQGYTQYGGTSTRVTVSSLPTSFPGLRPFGVSLLYAGYDPHYHFQLYHSDPSGNYSGWKATCIGANNGTAQSLLKQEYKDDMGVDEAIGLALRVMSRTMDSTTLGSEKCQSCYICVLCDPCADSTVSGICRVDVRRGGQASKGQDIQASRDRCPTQDARSGEKGPRYRDEVIVNSCTLFFFSQMLLSRHQYRLHKEPK